MTKRCADCGEHKPLEAFHRQAKSKDGRYPYCKSCCRARQRALYQTRDNKYRKAFKRCSWCLTDKPSEDFQRTPEGKRHARCIECEQEIALKEAAGLRRCNICREWLPTDRFHPSKLRFPHVACRECTRAQIAQPKYRMNRREYTLMKEYGITGEQYDELAAKQGGNCPICLQPLPPNRGGYVDHVHGGEHKGKIRAILHGICNRFVMWEHEDSAQLRRAADLIDNPLTDWMVPGKPSSEIRKIARRREKERGK